MPKRFLTTLFTIGLSLSFNPVFAQETAITEELYQLCSKFPYNSRCEDFEVPIPLKEREGVKTSCELRWGDIHGLQTCKFLVQGNSLKVYLETGEELSILEGQKASTEIVVTQENIMFFPVSKKYRWKRSIAQRPQIISNLDIFFRAESERIPNRSNRVSIYFPHQKLKEENLKTQQQLISFLNKQQHLNQEQSSIDSQLAYLQPQANNSDPSSNREQLLNTNECVRCNLSGVDLTGANLEGANLEGANLQDAILTEANLKGAYLLGAKLDRATLDRASLFEAELPFSSLNNSSFERADLSSINLQKADLANANLSESKLLFSNLKQANLSGANLTAASLKGVKLDGANLEAVNLTEAEISVGSRTIEVSNQYYKTVLVFALPSNLTQANLANANLTSAKLGGTIFIEANLTNAKFMGADFSPYKTGTNTLYISYLNRANLTNADLSNVKLTRSNLSNANLENAILSGSNLKLAQLGDANLANSDLSDADLHKAYLVNANLSNATLANTRMTRINMNGSNLSGVQLENADLKNSTMCNATMPDGSLASSEENCEN